MLVPLVSLLGLFGYLVTTSVTSFLTVTRSKAVMEELARPVAGLQRALAAERAQIPAYYAQPGPAGLSALQKLEAGTDRAAAAFQAVADSPGIRQSAPAGGRSAISGLLADTAQLSALRPGIPGRKVSLRQLLAAYGGALAVSYQVLEQAISQERNSAQVLPGIAVIQLAASGELLQQESALLNADFPANTFPAADRRDFASLVGARRLLYAQCLPYLTRADLLILQRDVSPRVAGRLAALENAVAADDSPKGPLPVRAAAWNAAAGTYSTQLRHAEERAAAGLAGGERSQADAELRTLFLTGGAGLLGVVVSVVFSLWIALGLARELSGLREAAVDLASRQLPGVVRRLRAGQEVDTESEVPPLEPGRDEIGEVKAALNAARRTAVQAAVDEARLRRGADDAFRNLAKRSQPLLHRQLALLDALQRRESDPENRQSLARLGRLTTRMRRHAESLVILAGDSPERGWRQPVPFVDVLRAAAAEVEEHTRIKVVCTSPGALAGPVVADVIHLITEFAENAALHSPPHTQIRIVGELAATGFAVEIVDRGSGLAGKQLADLNARLADPPGSGLPGSGQLGIVVAGRLAKRHGITASLARSPYGGVTAVLLIPLELVSGTDGNQRPGSGQRPGTAQHPGSGQQPGTSEQPAAGRQSGNSQRSGNAQQPRNAAVAPAAGARPATSGPDASGPESPPMDLIRLPDFVHGGPAWPAGQPAGQPQPDPEVARAVMSALRRGRKEGRAGPGAAAEPAAGPAEEDGQDG